MAQLILEVQSIEDRVIRENFQKLNLLIRDNPFLNGSWALIEIVATVATSEGRIKHNLGFVPEDTLLVYIEGNYNFALLNFKNDRDYLYYSAAGPAVAKVLVGRIERA